MWPLHGVVILGVLGAYYGAGVIADFTLALSLTAPLYYAVNYSLSTMIVVRPAAAGLPGSVLHLRLATCLTSVVVVWLAARPADSVVSAMVILVWTGRIGDMLFETYQACIITEPGARRRGWVLFVSGALRLAVAQGMLWVLVLGLRPSPTTLLLALAAGNLAVCSVFLIAVPRWQSLRVQPAELASLGRNVVAMCTPMTLTGAFLSLLLVLPRLLNETAMSTEERAVVGLAQTAASFVGSIFNAAWLYQSRQLKDLVATGNMGELWSAGTMLSVSFATALAAIVGTLWLAAEPAVRLLGFIDTQASLLTVVFAAISLLHVPAGLRDCLKLMGRYWEEAAIIVAAVGVAVAIHLMLHIVTTLDWTIRFIAVCVSGAVAQFTLLHFRASLVR